MPYFKRDLESQKDLGGRDYVAHYFINQSDANMAPRGIDAAGNPERTKGGTHVLPFSWILPIKLCVTSALPVLEGDAQHDIYKVEKILFGLGFTQEDLDKDPLSFSGGYQIRMNLVKLLVTEPNLLLLGRTNQLPRHLSYDG